MTHVPISDDDRNSSPHNPFQSKNPIRKVHIPPPLHYHGPQLSLRRPLGSLALFHCLARRLVLLLVLDHSAGAWHWGGARTANASSSMGVHANRHAHTEHAQLDSILTQALSFSLTIYTYSQQPFESLIGFIKDVNRFLEKLITWPRECGLAIVNCHERFPAPN